MGKKKKVEPEEEDFDDDDLDDFENDEIEIAVPTIEKKPPVKEKEKAPPIQEIPLSEESDVEALEEFELEPEEEIPTYRYLDLALVKGTKENDYELSISGQSHGFCNIFVKHLLEIKGVNIAAYKDTKLEPSKVFIRLEKGYDIKKILNQGIEILREDVAGVEKLFQKLL